jgi:nicotinamide mononucleotide transporter
VDIVEVLGFVSGALCVWLVARQNVWNWPIGIANNLVFLVMFWRARLFADAGLQVVYIVLAIYGWLFWIRGGAGQTQVGISRAPVAQGVALAAAIPLLTLGLRELLIAVSGSAPFLDALTTVLSLAAQYMMCRKQLEHWLLWIAADLIYVPLYIARGLPLTGALYAIFLLMCITGWRDWRRAWRSAADAA